MQRFLSAQPEALVPSVVPLLTKAVVLRRRPQTPTACDEEIYH